VHRRFTAYVKTWGVGVGISTLQTKPTPDILASRKTYAEERMRFDARAAATLPSGDHMTFAEFPGLRLQASSNRKSWTYRYKSPVDSRMRQVKLGEWPAMSFAGAIAAWEKSRAARDSGAELSALRRKKKNDAARPSPHDYTVGQLCRDYLQGYVEVNRKTKGAVEVARMFKAMLVHCVIDLAPGEFDGKDRHISI